MARENVQSVQKIMYSFFLIACSDNAHRVCLKFVVKWQRNLYFKKLPRDKLMYKMMTQNHK